MGAALDTDKTTMDGDISVSFSLLDKNTSLQDQYATLRQSEGKNVLQLANQNEHLYENDYIEDSDGHHDTNTNNSVMDSRNLKIETNGNGCVGNVKSTDLDYKATCETIRSDTEHESDCGVYDIEDISLVMADLQNEEEKVICDKSGNTKGEASMTVVCSDFDEGTHDNSDKGIDICDSDLSHTDSVGSTYIPTHTSVCSDVGSIGAHCGDGSSCASERLVWMFFFSWCCWWMLYFVIYRLRLWTFDSLLYF